MKSNKAKEQQGGLDRENKGESEGIVRVIVDGQQKLFKPEI